MWIKTFTLVILLISQYGAFAQEANDKKVFTIYLIRHAEKESAPTDSRDPLLSDCGTLRAKSLAGFFGKVDLEAIYSTDYNRTRNTAKPTANSKGITVKSYNPRALEDFALKLINLKQNALVVGHSNTTGALAALLAGQSGDESYSMSEKIYNRIYQVVIYKDARQLQLLQSAFTCTN